MMPFRDVGRMVLEITVNDRLGDRAPYFDVPGVVNAIVCLGFVDLDELDPVVFREVLDQNRKSV